MLFCEILPRYLASADRQGCCSKGRAKLRCSKQQPSALTTCKPLRRPIHPVMNDDSQRLSSTKSYSHAKPAKAFPRCSALQHWRLRGHGAAVCREMLKNPSHEPSRLEGEGEVQAQSGDAQRLCQNDRDCTGDRSLGRFLRQKIRRSPTSDSSMRAVLARRQGVSVGQ